MMKTTNKNLAICLAPMGMLLASVAYAQTTYVRPAYTYPPEPVLTGPAHVRMGDSPAFITPSLGLGAGYDDNLFLTSVNERSSTLYVMSPGFKVDARAANKVLQLSYQGQYGDYGQSPNDNYVDHVAVGQFDWALDRRNFLRLGLAWQKGHEPRGSTDRPFGSRPDKFEATNPSVTYAFGAPGALGRIETYYSYGNRRYLNNREITAASDRNTDEFGGAFYWRAMPKTYLLAEVRRTNIDYKQANSPNSGNEMRYYGGVTWEATAATIGTIKVGRLGREFDLNTQPKYTGTSWEGLVTWAPRTYSQFSFYTTRQTNESTGLGSFIVTSIAGVSWTHSWSSFWTTGVDLRYQKDQYQNFNRNDESKALGLKVGYRFRRWLTLGAEYGHTQRDSNLPSYEYDKNFYLLTATGSL